MVLQLVLKYLTKDDGNKQDLANFQAVADMMFKVVFTKPWDSTFFNIVFFVFFCFFYTILFRRGVTKTIFFLFLYAQFKAQKR